MRLTPEQRIEYLRAVWTNFQKKARTRREMSNAEFWIASKWLDRGLPLPVVLRAVQDFAGQPRRLEALAQGVEVAARHHFTAVGGLKELPEAGPLEKPEPFDVEAARKRRDEAIAAMRGKR